MLPASSSHPAAAKGDRPVPSDPADVYGWLAALAEFADEHGLTGLSPASLRPIEQTDTLVTDGYLYENASPTPTWTGDVKDHPGYGPASA